MKFRAIKNHEQKLPHGILAGFQTRVISLFLLGLLLPSCTASLIPGYHREVLYHWHSGTPWRIYVVDQFTVSAKCNEAIPGLGIFVNGCTVAKSREIWMIDSLVVAQHECTHLRQIDSRENDVVGEWIKDLTIGWLLDSALLAVAWPIPAGEKPCGEDYVYGSDPNSRWVKLPTAKEIPINGTLPSDKQTPEYSPTDD